MNDVVIINQKNLETAKKNISIDGAAKLHILADFDRTMTYAFVNGKNVPSMISILRDENYLSSDYAKEAHRLFSKYHPIEIDPKISKTAKKRAMKEWWMSHFDLLIESGLNKKDIASAITSDMIKLRDGFKEFASKLRDSNIPLIIMSSSGLGGNAIEMYLQRHSLLFDNIRIVSNKFEWDSSGNAKAVIKPIIHTLNKDETVLKKFPFYQEISDRKNVILLGDSLDDVGMIEGFDFSNLIKIAFINRKTEEFLEAYRDRYDILILEDGPLDFVNQLLKEIAY